MNWLERARREIQECARRPTANSAERTLTAVMAVPPPALREKLEGSIGSNGSTAPAHMPDIKSAQVEDSRERRLMEILTEACTGSDLEPWQFRELISEVDLSGTRRLAHYTSSQEETY